MEKSIRLTLEQARNLLGKSAELDEFLKANFSEQLLNNEVIRWEDLKNVEGWFVIDDGSVMYGVDSLTANGGKNIYGSVMYGVDGLTTYGGKNIYSTKNQAISARAMAQLSQLLIRYWKDWRPDFNNIMTAKFCIAMDIDEITITPYHCVNQFLAFPTREMSENFLKNHQSLIEEYFLMFKY